MSSEKAVAHFIKNVDDGVVFVKNSMNFSLNGKQMIHMKVLIEGILDGSLDQVDPDKVSIIKGD